MKTLAEKIAGLSYYQDTPPEVEKVQVNLLKKAGTGKRFTITLSFKRKKLVSFFYKTKK